MFNPIEQIRLYFRRRKALQAIANERLKSDDIWRQFNGLGAVVDDGVNTVDYDELNRTTYPGLNSSVNPDNILTEEKLNELTAAMQQESTAPPLSEQQLKMDIINRKVGTL